MCYIWQNYNFISSSMRFPIYFSGFHCGLPHSSVGHETTLLSYFLAINDTFSSSSMCWLASFHKLFNLLIFVFTSALWRMQRSFHRIDSNCARFFRKGHRGNLTSYCEDRVWLIAFRMICVFFIDPDSNRYVMKLIEKFFGLFSY